MKAIKAFIADQLAGFSISDIPNFLVALLLAAVLALILSKLYVKFGSSDKDKRKFARTLVTIAVSVAFMVAIAKASITLSIIVVGVLILAGTGKRLKDTEELSYLMLTLAIGFGCGVGHTILTAIAFVIAALLIVVVSRSSVKHFAAQYKVEISLDEALQLKELTVALKQYSQRVQVLHYAEGSEYLVTFSIDVKELATFDKVRNEVKSIHPKALVVFHHNPTK